MQKESIDPTECEWWGEDAVSACVKPGWYAVDDCGNAEVSFPAATSGAEAAQEYVDGGYWGDVETSQWVRVHTWRVVEGLTAESDNVFGIFDPEDHTITVQPLVPDCTALAHDWRSPHSVVGGIVENPGVWCKSGGVVLTQVCIHCGKYRCTDTWAQDPHTGKQGLESVTYRSADKSSEAWLLSLYEEQTQTF